MKRAVYRLVLMLSFLALGLLAIPAALSLCMMMLVWHAAETLLRRLA